MGVEEIQMLDGSSAAIPSTAAAAATSPLARKNPPVLIQVNEYGKTIT
jgi:hypothetical protein